MKRIFIVIVFSLLQLNVFAINYAEDNKLISHDFSTGWYFTGSLGNSYANIKSNDDDMSSFIGVSVSSSLGYNFNNFVGLEFGSFLNYNYFQASIIQDSEFYIPDPCFTIWNSFFYIALRVKLPVNSSNPNFNPYFKIYQGFNCGIGRISSYDKDALYNKIIGNGGTVNDYDTVVKNFADQRFFLEGPGFGWAIGNFFNVKNSGPIWYVELSVALMIYWQNYVLDRTDPVIPIIISSDSTSKNERLYSIFLSVGYRFF